MGLAQEIVLTAEDFFETPEDGNLYELLEGRMSVNPPPVPRHQRVVTLIGWRVGPWVETRKLGKWFQSPCGVVLSEFTVLQPDAFFIRQERLTELVQEKAIHGAPDLVVEVLSPGTARRDRTVKRQIYAAHGVREYWLISPDVEGVAVLALEGGAYLEVDLVSGDRLLPSLVLPGLPVKASEFFED